MINTKPSRIIVHIHQHERQISSSSLMDALKITEECAHLHTCTVIAHFALNEIIPRCSSHRYYLLSNFTRFALVLNYIHFKFEYLTIIIINHYNLLQTNIITSHLNTKKNTPLKNPYHSCVYRVITIAFNQY